MNLRILIIAIMTVVLVLLSSLYYYFPQNEEFTQTVVPQESHYMIEYPVVSPSSYPHAIAVDSSDNVWFVLENETALAVLSPRNNTIQVFPLPESKSLGLMTWGVSVDNTRGLVWFTDVISNAVWRFNMVSHRFQEFKMTAPNSFPYDLVLDGNGNVWFTELYNNSIGELTTQGSLFRFPVPEHGEPAGITIDNSGRIWFSLPNSQEIGSLSQGKFQLYNLTGYIVSPVGLAVDSAGNIWMTQHGPSLVSEFNPMSHYIRTISTTVPEVGGSLPYFVYLTKNGTVWFNEHQGNFMARFNPLDDTLIEYENPTRLQFAGNISGMLTMALSPSGEPWFSEFFAGKVGTVNVSEPLDVGVQLLNYSTPLEITNQTQGTLQLSVSDTSSGPVHLTAFAGNFTGNFSFTFSPPSGGGTFDSTLTIGKNDTAPGVYFITVGAASKDLVFSRIIEVMVT
jgi:virginiamycin B lyase